MNNSFHFLKIRRLSEQSVQLVLFDLVVAVSDVGEVDGCCLSKLCPVPLFDLVSMFSGTASLP
jgi:hypothetical protein